MNEKVLLLNYDKICRLCLQTTGAMSDIFDINDIDSEKPASLKKLIHKATGIEMEAGDGLPSKICHRCRYVVEISCQLKQTAVESNMLLKEASNVVTKLKKKEATEIVRPCESKGPPNHLTENTHVRRCGARTQVEERGALKRVLQQHTVNVHLCSKQFRNATYFREHCIRHHTTAHGQVRVEKRVRRWKCDKCPLTFRDVTALGSHRAASHRRRHGCSACGKRFRTEIKLNYHMEICQQAIPLNNSEGPAAVSSRPLLATSDVAQQTTNIQDSTLDLQEKEQSPPNLTPCTEILNEDFEDAEDLPPGYLVYI